MQRARVSNSINRAFAAISAWDIYILTSKTTVNRDVMSQIPSSEWPMSSAPISNKVDIEWPDNLRYWITQAFNIFVRHASGGIRVKLMKYK